MQWDQLCCLWWEIQIMFVLSQLLIVYICCTMQLAVDEFSHQVRHQFGLHELLLYIYIWHLKGKRQLYCTRDLCVYFWYCFLPLRYWYLRFCEEQEQINPCERCHWVVRESVAVRRLTYCPMVAAVSTTEEGGIGVARRRGIGREVIGAIYQLATFPRTGAGRRRPPRKNKHQPVSKIVSQAQKKKSFQEFSSEVSWGLVGSSVLGVVDDHIKASKLHLLHNQKKLLTEDP